MDCSKLGYRAVPVEREAGAGGFDFPKINKIEKYLPAVR